MNHILREIKLSNLADTPMSEDATMLVKFWNNLWCDMNVSVDPTKGEIKCWKDVDCSYYFRQDYGNGYLWCDHNKVWSFFRRDLGLNNDETRELIQQMVSDTLKCKVKTPIFIHPSFCQVVSDTLRRKVKTPFFPKRLY